jgi:hypothetical protein
LIAIIESAVSCKEKNLALNTFCSHETTQKSGERESERTAPSNLTT